MLMLREVILSSIYKGQKEYEKKLAEYLKEHPVIYDFLKAMDSEIDYVDGSGNFVLKNRFILQLEDYSFFRDDSETNLKVRVSQPINESHNMYVKESFIDLFKALDDKISRWLKTTEMSVDKLKVELGVMKEDVADWFVEVMDKSESLIRENEIQSKYFGVLAKTDEYEKSVIEIIGGENENEKNEILDVLVAASLVLIEYDVASGEEYIYDKSSADLTLAWIKERLKTASMLLELKEVEMVSKTDEVKLEEGLKNIYDFLQDDDLSYDLFNESAKKIRENVELNHGEYRFSGYEEKEESFLIPKELMMALANAKLLGKKVYKKAFEGK